MKSRHLILSTLICCLVGLRVSAQTVRPDSYVLGLSIQDGMRKGDLSAFRKAFDTDALSARALNPLKIPEQAREHLLQAMQSRTTAGAVADAFAGGEKSYSFVGVRRIPEGYCLLFRGTAEHDSLSYYGYMIGEAGAGRVTLVDVYCFAPGELLSETIRRQCVNVLSRLSTNLLEALEPKYRDFIFASPLLIDFGNACDAGDSAAAGQAYAKLPESLRTERYVLFNRARSALQSSESDFLAALGPWRDNYPKDVSLEMFMSEYYWAKNEDAKALKAFERLNDLLGGDPKIDLRIARLHLELQQPREARARLWQAVHRDPPDAAAFVALLQDTLSEHNYDDTARALTLQEEAFGVNLKERVKLEPTYEPFRQSPAYEAWLKNGADREKKGLQAKAPAPSGTLTLQGVMFSPTRSSALINGKTVFVGDSVAGHKVVKIEADSVTLKTSSGELKVLTRKTS